MWRPRATGTSSPSGKPVAEVVPANASPRPPARAWKDKIKILGDIVYFDTSDDWESNRRCYP
jgi:hypothetical protein